MWVAARNAPGKRTVRTRRRIVYRRHGRQDGDFVVVAVVPNRRVALPVRRQAQIVRLPLDEDEFVEVDQGIGEQGLGLEALDLGGFRLGGRVTFGKARVDGGEVLLDRIELLEVLGALGVLGAVGLDQVRYRQPHRLDVEAADRG